MSEKKTTQKGAVSQKNIDDLIHAVMEKIPTDVWAHETMRVGDRKIGQIIRMPSGNLAYLFRNGKDKSLYRPNPEKVDAEIRPYVAAIDRIVNTGYVRPASEKSHPGTDLSGAL